MTAVGLAFWIGDQLEYSSWFSSPLAWIAAAFQLWMLVDAVRREEWFWVLFIVLFPLINAILYFLMVYRGAPALANPSFEIPGLADRRRIKELEGQIHHLDKAHHHAALADIYFRQGRFTLAERSYRAALERDAEDLDTRARLGETLLRLGHPTEALPLLETVCTSNPKHNYGASQMALAECYAATGQTEKAAVAWQHVAEHYSYARARVQLAELDLAAGRKDAAVARLKEVVADAAHAPAFEQEHERPWNKRARRLLRTLER